MLYTKSKMDYLIKLSEAKASKTPGDFERYISQEIDWRERLIIIRGQRGTGKTTLLLQQLKSHPSKGIYLSLDDIYFEANRLINTINKLYDSGYRSFYLDELHRYEYWSKDLKNAYDNYPDIQITGTGSSILELSKGQADLSRRAAVYHLFGLSFREFLHLQYNSKFPVYSLEDILENHQDIAVSIADQRDVLKEFREYTRIGYYPYFKEGVHSYPHKLKEATHLVLDVDVALFEDLNTATVRNMKKLLYVLSLSVPFKPNISKLSKKLDIPRNTILKILTLLDKAEVLALLRSHTKGVSYLQKPEKIYLQNPNLIYLFSDGRPSMGSLRETFFLNQTQVRHQVTSSRVADFMLDDMWTFEIGGVAKRKEQIRGIPHAYIVSDGIKEGMGNKIPLWLFGFLY